MNRYFEESGKGMVCIDNNNNMCAFVRNQDEQCGS